MASKTGNALEMLDMLLDSAQLIQVVPRLYKRYVKGENPDVEKIRELEGMIKDGKPHEAMAEVMSSWATGFSKKDNFMLLARVCGLIITERLTVDEGWEFFAFLERQNADFRKDFIDGFVSTSDMTQQNDVIVVLARLKDDAQRLAFFNGPGFNDPDSLEKALEAIKSPMERLGAAARKDLVRLEERVKELRDEAKANKKPRRQNEGTWTGALGSILKFRIF